MDSIQVVNLSKTFGKVVALDNVSTTLRTGKIYALLGHNGAGKTTLLKHVLGLYRIQVPGSVIYSSAGKHEGKNFRKDIMFSSEDVALFDDLTVDEHINFIINVHRIHEKDYLNEYEKLLHMFELQNKRKRLINTLSNGMKKKVSLIAALIAENKFCVIDEPFAALDPEAIFCLKNYLVSNVNRATYILSTHQLAILESFTLADALLELILMKEGKIVFQGSKKELLEYVSVDNIEEAYLKFYTEGESREQ